MDNNYIVDAAHAGEKTVYFRPDGQGGEGWHYGVIYVSLLTKISRLLWLTLPNRLP